MRPQLFDVVDLEPMGAKDFCGRPEREIREVLVVDGVVLEPVEQAKEVRKLEGRGPVVTQKDLHSRDEVVQIWDLREHVVARDQTGALALVDQSLSGGAAEEVDEGGHSALLGSLRDIGGRVDPQNRYAGADEVLKEVAVVRRELDDEVVRAQAEALADHLHVLPRVLDPGSRVRRVVRVLGEDLVRRDERFELHEVAPLACEDVKREERLHVPDLLGAEKALAQRRHAEVDDRQVERGTAKAARRLSIGARAHDLSVSGVR